MTFGAAPDLALRPKGEFSQLFDLGMLVRGGIGQWQIVGVENAGFGAEALENTGSFLDQKPAKGPFPQRSVKEQNTGRVISPRYWLKAPKVWGGQEF
jgi:hypothetical protein